VSKKEKELDAYEEYKKERTQKYLKKISEIYGISVKEFGSFLEEKRTKGPSEKEH